MPGIVVFKRRWMVASDDFVIPFGIAFVLRGLWMIVLSVSVGIFHGFYHMHQADEEDKHVCEQTLDYFMGGYLALLFASNIMELSIAWMSGKGSIMDTEPRNLIPQLLYVRLVLSIIELLWLSIGIKWIFLDVTICELTPEIYIARAIVVFNWLFLFSVIIIVYCAFDSAGKHWVRFREAQLTEDSVDASHSITRKYEKRWEGCFKRCCCCSGVGQGDENVFNFIGRKLAEYFQDLEIYIVVCRHLRLLRMSSKMTVIQKKPLRRANMLKSSSPFDFCRICACSIATGICLTKCKGITLN